MSKKEALLQTAVHLFVKQGFENTPTSQITAEAGVASGTLFYHFKTKDELLQSAYESVYDDLMEAVSPKYDASKPLKEKMYAFWVAYIVWGFENKVEQQLIRRFKFVDSKRRYVPEYETPLDDLGDSIADGVKSGELRNVSLKVLTNVYNGLYEVFMDSFYELGELDEGLLDDSFDILWDALSGAGKREK